MRAAFSRHGLSFGLAGPGDEGAIAELLRLPMPGRIELSLECAPEHLGAMHPQAKHTVMLARRASDGAPAGMVSRTDLPSFVDGAPATVAWLGQWRIAAPWRGRPALLRAGFEAARLLGGAGPAPYYLAAVIADNTPARRLLEARIRGFPKAARLFGLKTLIIAARRGRAHGVRRAGPDEMAEIADFLDSENRPRQFAPRLDGGEGIAAGHWPGLRPGDFLVARGRDGIAGVAALWDQTPRRRVVVQGYDARLAAMRRLLNLGAPLTGLPRLPPAGATLAAAFLAFLTVRDDAPEAAVALVRAGLDAAARRGLTMVSLGLATSDPLLPVIARAFRHRTYASEVYAIAWPVGLTAPAPTRPKIDVGLL